MIYIFFSFYNYYIFFHKKNYHFIIWISSGYANGNI